MMRNLKSLGRTRTFRPPYCFNEIFPPRISKKWHQFSGQPILNIFFWNLMHNSIKSIL